MTRPPYIEGLNEYQNEVRRTMGTLIPAAPRELAILALGVAGEAGEVADLIKKHVGHGHPLDKEKLILELGDVLWYVAALAESLNARMDDVASANAAKLRKRYPDGFDQERSKQRSE